MFNPPPAALPPPLARGTVRGRFNLKLFNLYVYLFPKPLACYSFTALTVPLAPGSPASFACWGGLMGKGACVCKREGDSHTPSNKHTPTAAHSLPPAYVYSCMWLFN